MRTLYFMQQNHHHRVFLYPPIFEFSVLYGRYSPHSLFPYPKSVAQNQISLRPNLQRLLMRCFVTFKSDSSFSTSSRDRNLSPNQRPTSIESQSHHPFASAPASVPTIPPATSAMTTTTFFTTSESPFFALASRLAFPNNYPLGRFDVDLDGFGEGMGAGSGARRGRGFGWSTRSERTRTRFAPSSSFRHVATHQIEDSDYVGGRGVDENSSQRYIPRGKKEEAVEEEDGERSVSGAVGGSDEGESPGNTDLHLVSYTPYLCLRQRHPLRLGFWCKRELPLPYSPLVRDGQRGSQISPSESVGNHEPELNAICVDPAVPIEVFAAERVLARCAVAE
ncbi:hypothetical protein GYMLUDRAFT_243927 [Collybiopsis luxurians FD-317 M1]|uniref:Uncharacterized protein n=1 Tax=Collybiopsis luxurians FD-317 M1 TaxID=944289 RepID=A0A0D0CX37_9AGAR|nr:hypothetical protein GYMLUDRAFT_243927 [Collybiopsis luxurians FD-317 M1]